MTQEETQILLKDICARLPYGVRVKQGSWEHTLESANMYNVSFDSSCAIPIPYLRPMSSMTEEERNEYLDVKMQECERVVLAEVYRPEAISIVFDWLNAHHFDYRGLIEKGLALEAPEGMYKEE